jgi:hypothetical protein
MTGTATVLNLVLTAPDVTVEEIRTNCFPVASAVVAAESALTVTVIPSA